MKPPAARPHLDPRCQCSPCEAWDIDAGLRALDRALAQPRVSPADAASMEKLVRRPKPETP
jgi:hypothetical protein